ncbi:MAG: hypothetical protein CW716_06930 [Candidatus Bathyarchaeum sp.]|nr:MAG: hypothetical protein CW716_06930 [Candidatus Bathyarchaeum sp.]
MIVTWQLTILVAYATRVRINMSGELKMLDVGKWNSQANESVRHQLEKASADGLACVGHCLLYMDHKGDHILWLYDTHLAFDPENPPPEEDRKRLERIFDGYAMLAQKIMNGEVETH